MKQLAVGKIDHPDEARDHMEVPEEVGVDSYVSEELRQKIPPEGNPVIGAGRGEVSHVGMRLNDLCMCDSVALHEKT